MSVTTFTERQKEIIEASIRLIAQGGIQELTIKNLSHAIGISEPALYRHFAGKQAILQGLVDFFAEGSRATFEGVAASELPSREKLHSVLTALFDQFAKHPPLSAVLFSEEMFQNDGVLADRVLEVMQTGQRCVREIVRQGVAAGELRDDLPAEHLVVIFMGALRMTVTKWRLTKYGFDLRREGDTLWESLRALVSSGSAGGATG